MICSCFVTTTLIMKNLRAQNSSASTIRLKVLRSFYSNCNFIRADIEQRVYNFITFNLKTEQRIECPERLTIGTYVRAKGSSERRTILNESSFQVSFVVLLKNIVNFGIAHFCHSLAYLISKIQRTHESIIINCCRVPNYFSITKF